jgi:hypothetical protein
MPREFPPIVCYAIASITDLELQLDLAWGPERYGRVENDADEGVHSVARGAEHSDLALIG